MKEVDFGIPRLGCCLQEVRLIAGQSCGEAQSWVKSQRHPKQGLQSLAVHVAGPLGLEALGSRSCGSRAYSLGTKLQLKATSKEQDKNTKIRLEGGKRENHVAKDSLEKNTFPP